MRIEFANAFINFRMRPKQAIAVLLEANWCKSLADTWPVGAGTGFNIKNGTVPVTDDGLPIGAEVCVFAPGERRASDVGTRIAPRLQLVVAPHHKHRVASRAHDSEPARSALDKLVDPTEVGQLGGIQCACAEGGAPPGAHFSRCWKRKICDSSTSIGASRAVQLSSWMSMSASYST